MTRKTTTCSDQLRAAIQAGPKTMGQIARESGIDIATISRFLHRKGGLSMDGLDRIAQRLGLSLTTEKQTRKQKDR